MRSRLLRIRFLGEWLVVGLRLLWYEERHHQHLRHQGTADCYNVLLLGPFSTRVKRVVA